MILSDAYGDGVAMGVMGVIRAGWINLGLVRESIFWKLFAPPQLVESLSQ
jgi:hypothetical protein